MSGQERKCRPGGGMGKPGEQESDFETVVVPPVSDISAKLSEALKQELGPTPCRFGCYCRACLRGDCNSHSEEVTRKEYMEGVR